ncbi:MAG: cell division protein FtsX [Fidelibacterota bacterium]|jgi:cell division transport system permease protein|tara:strand:+ start:7575 stop:8444 length:870 start_codon:yes stop_codon:yes gene_type:complete
MDKMMFLLSEGLKNLWRHKLTAFTAVFSIFLTLTVAGSLIVVSDNTGKIIDYLRDKYKIEVFFKQNTSNERIKEIVKEFQSIRGVRSTTVITKSDAKKIFKSQFGENILDIVGFNPLPASCVINLVKEKKDKLNLRPIIDRLRKFSEVDEVNYQGRLINRIENSYQAFVKVSIILLIIILIISILIISNTVRLTIYAKKDLIKSFQLVGATRAFVKTPFILEGIFHGLIGAVFASVLLLVSLEFSSNFIFTITGVKIDYSFLNLFFILSSLGIVISFLGSNRAISQFLK